MKASTQRLLWFNADQSVGNLSERPKAGLNDMLSLSVTCKS